MGVLGINYIARATVCVDASLSQPALWNDAARYYNYALQLFHHQSSGNAVDPFPGLPLLTVLLWKVFGISIVPPLAMNMMLTLATIVLTGSLASSLLDGRTSMSSRQVAWLAMAMTATLFFFLSHGTQMLKEPLTYFGVMLCALALASLTRLNDTRLAWRPIALFALGITIVAMARTTYSIMMLAGVLFIGVGNRPQWRNALAMLVLGIHWPAPVQTVVSNVGGMITPLSLIIIGVMLSENDLVSIFREKAVYLVMALRNFLIPVLAMLVLMAVPMDVQDKLCVLVYLSCPCATLTTIYSIQTDTRPELCARSVLFSTISFAISLPVVIAAGQFLFGV